MSSPYVLNADDLSFNERVINRSIDCPVLIDCWAEWCGPCKQLTPRLETLADEYQGRFELVKVNIEEAPQVAMMLRVQSVPFLVLFIGGRPVDALSGAVSDSELRAFLDRHLPEALGDLYEESLTALSEGKLEAALRGFEGVYTDQPDRFDAVLMAARTALQLGQLTLAENLIERVPSDHAMAQDANALKEVFAFVEFAGDLSDIRRRLEQDPKDSIALYQLGATSAINGNFANALDAFLKVVLYDRNYQDDGGRRAILKIFNALGGQGELVTQYRRKLGALLF